MTELIVGGAAIVLLIIVAGYLLARERIDDEQSRADVEAGARERAKPELAGSDQDPGPRKGARREDRKTEVLDPPFGAQEPNPETRRREARKTEVLDPPFGAQESSPSPNEGDTEAVAIADIDEQLERSSPNEGDTAYLSMSKVAKALEPSAPDEGDTAYLSMAEIQAMLERSSPNEGDTEHLSMSKVDAALGRSSEPAAPAAPAPFRFAPPGSKPKPKPKPRDPAEVFADAHGGMIRALTSFEALLAQPRYEAEDAAETLASWDAQLDQLRSLERAQTLGWLVNALANTALDTASLAATTLALVELDTSPGLAQSAATLAACLTRTPAAWTGIARGLTLWPNPAGDALVSACLDASSEDPVAARYLDLLLARGARPSEAQRQRALASKHESVLAAGLRSLTRDDAELVASRLEGLYVSRSDMVRRAALEAGLVCGLPTALIHCRQRARKPEDAAFACELLAIAAPEERDTLRRWAAKSPVRAEALAALGVAGERADIEACIAALTDADPQVELAARRAFSHATGFRPGGTTTPSEWWRANQSRFEATGRYLDGHPYEHVHVAAVLRSGEAGQRRALARELWLRSGGHLRVGVDRFVNTLERDIAALSERALVFDEPLHATRV